MHARRADRLAAPREWGPKRGVEYSVPLTAVEADVG
jgi:hypothetical protein